MKWIKIEDELPPVCQAVLFRALSIIQDSPYIIFGINQPDVGGLVSNAFLDIVDDRPCWVVDVKKLSRVTHWAKINWPEEQE